MKADNEINITPFNTERGTVYQSGEFEVVYCTDRKLKTFKQSILNFPGTEIRTYLEVTHLPSKKVRYFNRFCSNSECITEFEDILVKEGVIKKELTLVQTIIGTFKEEGRWKFVKDETMLDSLYMWSYNDITATDYNTLNEFKFRHYHNSRHNDEMLSPTLLRKKDEHDLIIGIISHMDEVKKAADERDSLNMYVSLELAYRGK